LRLARPARELQRDGVAGVGGALRRVAQRGRHPRLLQQRLGSLRDPECAAAEAAAGPVATGIHPGCSRPPERLHLRESRLRSRLPSPPTTADTLPWWGSSWSPTTTAVSRSSSRRRWRRLVTRS